MFGIARKALFISEANLRAEVLPPVETPLADATPVSPTGIGKRRQFASEAIMFKPPSVRPGLLPVSSSSSQYAGLGVMTVNPPPADTTPVSPTKIGGVRRFVSEANLFKPSSVKLGLPPVSSSSSQYAGLGVMTVNPPPADTTPVSPTKIGEVRRFVSEANLLSNGITTGVAGRVPEVAGGSLEAAVRQPSGLEVVARAIVELGNSPLRRRNSQSAAALPRSSPPASPSADRKFSPSH